jgi:hypothetical protein
MLDPPNHRPLDLRPINAVVKRLVHDADSADVVAPDDVEAERDLGRRLGVIWRADHALDCALQNLCARAPKETWLASSTSRIARV